MQLIPDVAKLHKMLSVQASGLLLVANGVYAYAQANPSQLQLVLNVVPPKYVPLVNAAGVVTVILLRSIHQPALCATDAAAVPTAPTKKETS